MVNQIAFVTSKKLGNNKLFDIAAGRDSCLERFYLLKEALSQNNIKCDTLDLCDRSDVDILIFSDIASSLKYIIKSINLNQGIKLLYLPTEPPIVSCFHESNLLAALPFERVLYWNDLFVSKNKHAVKCNIGQPIITLESIPALSFQGKRFLSAIYSNKLIKHKNGLYEERLRAFDYFSGKPEGFELFGVGWQSSVRPSVVKSYKGKCETKKDVLKGYKFSICFENTKDYPGLITEKIFDCFAAGTIPIYYGAPNVQDYIPETCFIDFRKFRGYEELYKFLINMSESEYNDYLGAVKEFIQAPEYYEFTSKRYAEIVFKQIESLMDEPNRSRTVWGFKWSLLKIIFAHPLIFLNNFKQCRYFLFDFSLVW